MKQCGELQWYRGPLIAQILCPKKIVLIGDSFSTIQKPILNGLKYLFLTIKQLVFTSFKIQYYDLKNELLGHYSGCSFF